MQTWDVPVRSLDDMWASSTGKARGDAPEGIIFPSTP